MTWTTTLATTTTTLTTTTTPAIQKTSSNPLPPKTLRQKSAGSLSLNIPQQQQTHTLYLLPSAATTNDNCTCLPSPPAEPVVFPDTFPETQDDTCPQCSGTGYVTTNQEEPCFACPGPLLSRYPTTYDGVGSKGGNLESLASSTKQPTTIRIEPAQSVRKSSSLKGLIKRIHRLSSSPSSPSSSPVSPSTFYEALTPPHLPKWLQWANPHNSSITPAATPLDTPLDNTPCDGSEADVECNVDDDRFRIKQRKQQKHVRHQRSSTLHSRRRQLGLHVSAAGTTISTSAHHHHHHQDTHKRLPDAVLSEILADAQDSAGRYHL
ncbi:hypothetical protein DFS34DRAFT_638737 [Phlyctochytrium arcticum]|nr:hypothetical protein DFS34DRAFT_641257 [Phlyctochytrium arcticum]KAI9089873.1 hypothetical protein DFS34DRAFT_638737 [Phlyctochytrium arcticum]